MIFGAFGSGAFSLQMYLISNLSETGEPITSLLADKADAIYNKLLVYFILNRQTIYYRGKGREKKGRRQASYKLKL